MTLVACWPGCSHGDFFAGRIGELTQYRLFVFIVRILCSTIRAGTIFIVMVRTFGVIAYIAVFADATGVSSIALLGAGRSGSNRFIAVPGGRKLNSFTADLLTAD